MNKNYSLKTLFLKKTDKFITKYKYEKKLKNMFSYDKSLDILAIYNKSRKWILNNSIPQKGIRPQYDLSSDFDNIAYPEVSGYYIPTLINWGFSDLALTYAKWLVSIQHKDGSWYDYRDIDPYVFDTGQILKGLIAAYPYMPACKDSIIKGCDYLLSQMCTDGRLPTPSERFWYDGITTELIHLYCLTPLVDASKMFDMPQYLEAANKILKYYIDNYSDKLADFHTLSHFYAYQVEALIDLGQTELAKEAMRGVAKVQKKNGFIPAYKNVNWTCSTGLFQFALCWYKLGEKHKADLTFDYAASLQTKNGGWLGSYKKGASYLPCAEISWANKYFLDALSAKISAHFANTTDTKMPSCNGTYALEDTINSNDLRLQGILNILEELKPTDILDVGCGLGRMLKKIHKIYPDVELYGVDIADEILNNLPEYVHSKKGSLLNIPYENNKFDFIMSVEALEHAIDIDNAIKELTRVLKPNGHLLILDKNIKMKGALEMPPWEQWFDSKELALKMEQQGLKIKKVCSIKPDDELYIIWLGEKL